MNEISDIANWIQQKLPPNANSHSTKFVIENLPQTSLPKFLATNDPLLKKVHLKLNTSSFSGFKPNLNRVFYYDYQSIAVIEEDQSALFSGDGIYLSLPDKQNYTIANKGFSTRSVFTREQITLSLNSSMLRAAGVGEGEKLLSEFFIRTCNLSDNRQVDDIFISTRNKHQANTAQSIYDITNKLSRFDFIQYQNLINSRNILERPDISSANSKLITKIDHDNTEIGHYAFSDYQHFNNNRRRYIETFSRPKSASLPKNFFVGPKIYYQSRNNIFECKISDSDSAVKIYADNASGESHIYLMDSKNKSHNGQWHKITPNVSGGIDMMDIILHTTGLVLTIIDNYYTWQDDDSLNEDTHSSKEGGLIYVPPKYEVMKSFNN